MLCCRLSSINSVTYKDMEESCNLDQLVRIELNSLQFSHLFPWVYEKTVSVSSSAAKSATVYSVYFKFMLPLLRLKLWLGKVGVWGGTKLP